jgi:hypothetical protein
MTLATGEQQVKGKATQVAMSAVSPVALGFIRGR